MDVFRRPSVAGDQVALNFGPYNVYIVDEVKIGDSFDMLAEDGKNYEAKIISIKDDMVTFHFPHWSKRFDVSGHLREFYIVPVNTYSLIDGLNTKTNRYPIMKVVRPKLKVKVVNVKKYSPDFCAKPRLNYRKGRKGTKRYSPRIESYSLKSVGAKASQSRKKRKIEPNAKGGDVLIFDDCEAGVVNYPRGMGNCPRSMENVVDEPVINVETSATIDAIDFEQLHILFKSSHSSQISLSENPSTFPDGFDIPSTLSKILTPTENDHSIGRQNTEQSPSGVTVLYETPSYDSSKVLPQEVQVLDSDDVFLLEKPTRQSTVAATEAVSSSSSSSCGGESSRSSDRFYHDAWAILCDSRMFLSNKHDRVLGKLDEIGVYAAEHLADCEDAELLEIASSLKKVPKSRFERYLSLKAEVL